MSKEPVGEYVNKFFVSSFQRVGTFRVRGNGTKNGGNVASYFCTPEGRVLHIVAGPVDEKTFLREARWAVELVKLARLEEIKTMKAVQAFFQRAHLDRLRKEYRVNVSFTPNMVMQPAQMKRFLQRLRGRGSANQRKAHYLLANYPLAKIGALYKIVFEQILNERISTDPVKVGRLTPRPIDRLPIRRVEPGPSMTKVPTV